MGSLSWGSGLVKVVSRPDGGVTATVSFLMTSCGCMAHELRRPDSQRTPVRKALLLRGRGAQYAPWPLVRPLSTHPWPAAVPRAACSP